MERLIRHYRWDITAMLETMYKFDLWANPGILGFVLWMITQNTRWCFSQPVPTSHLGKKLDPLRIRDPELR